MKSKSVRSNILPFFDAYRKKKRCYFFVVKVHFTNKLLKTITLIIQAYEEKDRQENKVKNCSFFFWFLSHKVYKKITKCCFFNG